MAPRPLARTAARVQFVLRASWLRPVLLGLPAVVCLFGAGNAAPGAARPDDANFPARNCADRYGAPVFAPQIHPDQSAHRTVTRTFGARRFWGIGQNMTVVKAGRTPALRVRYPAGSTAPSIRDHPLGGAGFYAPARLSGSLTACLTYRVRFPKDFEFVEGGKLPGLYGGARAPSGGAQPRGDDGFTLRLMWREDGAGEIYLYAPNMRPSSRFGGMDLGLGFFRFPRGRWVDVEIEMGLNAPGRSDGWARLRIDGKPAIVVSGIRFRSTDALSIGGLMFSTFFGGKSSRFAPGLSQSADFAAFRIYAGPS